MFELAHAEIVGAVEHAAVGVTAAVDHVSVALGGGDVHAGAVEFLRDKRFGRFGTEVAEEHNQRVAAGGEGYLVNKLYPEMGEGWMVDAGYGWSITEGYAGNKYEDRICPIAYYTHYLWNVNGVEKRSFLTKAIINLRDAYLYTGEEKYGVAGAILVDRFADMYPTYDFQKVSLCYMSNHGGARNGKTVGSASEKELLIE